MENAQSFSQMIFRQAEKYGDKTVLKYRDNNKNEWLPISWNELAKQIKIAAKSFYEDGLQEQQCVGIFSQNKPECFVADFALFANRAITIPMYATSTAEQVDYIVNDAQISVIFVGEQYQYDVALTVLKKSKFLKKLIVFDSNVKIENDGKSIYFQDFLKIGENSANYAEVEARSNKITEKDIATIMYTSGTTGEPKGVVLPYSCYIEAMRIHDIRLPFIKDTLTSISFLPLTHIFERAWCYFCLHRGVQIFVNLEPVQIQRTVQETRAEMMCSVPRFWEKVYAGIEEKLATYSPLMIGVIAWAITVGKKYNLDYLREEKKPPVLLSLRYKIADKLVFSKLKKTIGIENGVLYPTAGAALSDEICEFFRSLGIPITYGYGLTETTATVACFERTKYVFGSVGKIMPDIEAKIGEDNEILLKGKTIFREYYNKPQATEQAFTADGWFRTGDAGKIVDGHLFLTERIKDLFKTSNGKYIAPQQIETKLVIDKYIEQVAVIGDQRNFVTALIVPNIPNLKEYAKEQNISYASDEELLKNAQINEMLQARINDLQKGMASFEHIKKFTLIAKGFTMESGELTNTLKIRRTIISEKYKDLIDEMYKK
jgi:long-chain acyl-CoA synthetase